MSGYLLRDRKITRAETQTLIWFREVKRKRVVDAYADPCGRQILPKLLSVRDL